MNNSDYGLFQLIESDLKRVGSPNLYGFIKSYCFPQGNTFPYVLWLRIVSAIKKTKLLKYSIGPFVYLVLRHYEFKYGIHANTNISIGPGLKIVHGGAVYLNCTRIGKNATIYQNVTLGSKYDSDSIPTIGDNVTVYPGSVIVGKIILNNGCTVGALSYVDKDVPPNAVVIGAPARRIK